MQQPPPEPGVPTGTTTPAAALTLFFFKFSGVALNREQKAGLKQQHLRGPSRRGSKGDGFVPGPSGRGGLLGAV